MEPGIRVTKDTEKIFLVTNNDSNKFAFLNWICLTFILKRVHMVVFWALSQLLNSGRLERRETVLLWIRKNTINMKRVVKFHFHKCWNFSEPEFSPDFLFSSCSSAQKDLSWPNLKHSFSFEIYFLTKFYYSDIWHSLNLSHACYLVGNIPLSVS